MMNAALSRLLRRRPLAAGYRALQKSHQGYRIRHLEAEIDSLSEHIQYLIHQRAALVQERAGLLARAVKAEGES